jgi:serine/threonine protein phosphatase 1
MVPPVKPFLRRLLGLNLARDYPPLPQPDPPLCLIGDLHGRADLLDMLLARIASEPRHAEARLVFVGDLIDRGPDSAAVLHRIRGLCAQDPARVICLMGNHERMMLDFLEAPAGRAKRWLAAGGTETLLSFGLSPRVPDGMSPTLHFASLAQALRAALQPDLLSWLSNLPLYWQEAGLAVVHADALPYRPITAQPEAALLWGQVPTTQPRSDGLWLAHGHVIVPQVQITPGRIALDTGAWRTGRLSALWLGPDGQNVIEVGLPS